MSWAIRHEGSPTAIEGLTPTAIAEGLRDGIWEPTDEVKGPSDARWTALEEHPQFAELAADWEPPPTPHHEDDTKFDMNPLIDVTLVLLIFFMLTTSYAALQKVLDSAVVPPETPRGARILRQDDVRERAILVEAKHANGVTTILVDEQPVELKDLTQALTAAVAASKKSDLLLKADPEVDWGTCIRIKDAAKGADIKRILEALTKQ